MSLRATKRPDKHVEGPELSKKRTSSPWTVSRIPPGPGGWTSSSLFCSDRAVKYALADFVLRDLDVDALGLAAIGDVLTREEVRKGWL